uniref:Lactadherin n=1 Tax=Schistocephalus solidus TaxID=70667 RepID=A0A0X3P242_SCHSO
MPQHKSGVTFPVVIFVIFPFLACSGGVLVMDKEQVDQGSFIPPAYDSCEQDDLLGMISLAITDAQITASSVLNNAWSKDCAPANGRLYMPNGLAWCPKYKSSTEWLQVDLGIRATITGILLQGRGDGREWVSSFTISFSNDGNFWTAILDQYGNVQVFDGNTESFQVKHAYLDYPVVARYVRIHPFAWNRHPSFRVELIGCQPCKQLLGTPPYARYAASSTRNKRNTRSCNPEDGHYLSNRAWCAKRQNSMQWFQLDLGPPTMVTGVVLRSRGDGKWPQYVTHFKVSYSNDSKLWFFYKDAPHMDQHVFLGNSLDVPERIHFLAAPVIARFVRIHPIAWHGRIAMRVGLLGCRYRGPCGPGFFQVNEKSSCIANLAYKKDAWMSNNPDNPRKKETEDRLRHSLYQHPLSSPPSPSRFPFVARSQQQKQTLITTQRFYDSQRQVSSSPQSSINALQMGNDGGLSQTTPINDWKLHDVMLGDEGYVVKDEVAKRAVDGFVGNEKGAIGDLTTEESGRDAGKVSGDGTLGRLNFGKTEEAHKPGLFLMNDSPSRGIEKQRRALRSVPKEGQQCTILRFGWPYLETPGWHVDLQESFEVNGVVLYTARHGKGGDQEGLIARSLPDTPETLLRRNNLDRLVIYVETDNPGEESAGTHSDGREFCGQVTRRNDAVFLPKLHIPCRRPITGRYVYVEAHGLRGAWPKEFLAALCEVQVY